MKLIKKIWKPFYLVFSVMSLINAVLIWAGVYHPGTYNSGMTSFFSALFALNLALRGFNDWEAQK